MLYGKTIISKGLKRIYIMEGVKSCEACLYIVIIFLRPDCLSWKFALSLSVFCIAASMATLFFNTMIY